MKRIQTILIHLLGGVTKFEAFRAHVMESAELIKDVRGMSLSLGSLLAVKSLIIYADSLNGLPADEWCKKMYDTLSADIENYQKMYDRAKKNDDNKPEQSETDNDTE